MLELAPRIVGTGWKVPDKVRRNDDPVFDWLHENQPPGRDLFKGYVERRVLAPGETLMTLMVPAARKAMEAAGVGPGDIDMLIGYASVSPYETPNELAHLHKALALDARAFVVPINCQFSNFNASLLMAHALISSGAAGTVLVVVGGNWTQHVDYRSYQAISAADGAGAAVLRLSADTSRFRFIDQSAITDSSYFGGMYMAREPSHFQINELGLKGFGEFGVRRAPGAVTALLAKQGLSGADISLVSHQASSVLLDAWSAAIGPAQYIHTIPQFANMTLANIPVNLAWAEERQPIRKDHLVLLGIGAEQHANAQLWRRGEG